MMSACEIFRHSYVINFINSRSLIIDPVQEAIKTCAYISLGLTCKTGLIVVRNFPVYLLSDIGY